MAIIPVVLDEHPAYLDGDAEDGSLLLAPLGAGVVLDEVAAALARLTPHGITVLSTRAGDQGYAERVRLACRQVHRILAPTAMADPLAHFDACDTLVLVSPRYYADGGLDVRALVAVASEGAQTVHHLLAFETTSSRTKELVHGGAGHAGRVQRYFEPATWPFSAGVIATLAPVLCVLQCADTQWSSLAELRSILAAAGTPSVDLPVQATLYDLASEEGMLALCERRIVAATSSRRRWSGDRSHHRLQSRSRRRPDAHTHRPAHAPEWVPFLPLVTASAVVAPSACLVGPVVVRDGAMIDAEALVVGPALIGPGARIGRRSVVAQCAVGAGVTVPENATVRHRVVMGGAPHRLLSNPRRSIPPSLPPAPRASRYARVKRAVEPALALLAIVMLLPIFVVVGVLIRLTSAGPVFYGDPREGKDGRLFRCWKFRTMVVNADEMQRALAHAQEMDGPHFKMERDPRVTRVGRWLRASTLDELPQIVNILRGEMSFVGPRPGPRRENQICVPWRSGRLSVQPGMTGLWQVCRHDRSTGDFYQWIEYDLLYVKHASLAVDCRIILATISTLLRGQPARVERIIGARGDAQRTSREPLHEPLHEPVRDRAREPRARIASVGALRLGASELRQRALGARRSVRFASIVSLAAALSLVASPARAQSSGQPGGQGSGQPGGQGGQGGSGPAPRDTARAPVGQRYWTLGLSLGQGYTTNVLFATPNGADDRVSRASAELGGVLRNTRTQFELLGTGSMSRYDRVSQLDQFTYGVHADVTHAVTPRLNVGAVVVAQRELSSDVASAPGLPLLPFALTQTQAYTGTAAYRTGPITTLTTAAGYTRTTYGTSALDRDDAMFGRIGATRAWTPSRAFGALYTIQQRTTGSLRLVSQTASGEYLAAAGPLRWHLRAGAVALDESDRTGVVLRPQGEVELQTAHTTDGSIALRYDRSVDEEPGVARVLTTDAIAASIVRAIRYGFAVDVNANQGWSSDLNHTGTRITTSSITAGLRRTLARGLSIELGGFYQSRKEDLTLVSTGVMLTAGYHIAL